MTGEPAEGKRPPHRLRWHFRLVALGFMLGVVFVAFEIALRDRWSTTFKAAAQHSWHEFDAERGWRHKRSVQMNAERTADSPDLARPFEVRLNALGLREDRELTLPAPKEIRRVACLGDSYTFGWCVPPGATFARRLQARFGSTTEVWNWGVAGYGLDQSLLELERDLLPTRPDLVVFSVIDANFRRATTRLGPGLIPKPRFTLSGDRLVRPEPVRELHPGDRYGRTDASGSYVVWSLSQAIDRARIHFAADPEAATEDWQLGLALIREAAADCRAARVPLLVALLPTVTHLDHEPLERLMLEAMPREGIAFVNVCPAFRARRGPDHPLFIPADRHPDEEGHEIIADELQRAIRELKLLPD